jgi:hypothetical protein
MFRLGQKVVIIGDHFEQNLPIGEHAYIIAQEKNADNAFDYVVRVPKLNRNVFVPIADIQLEEILLQQEADRIEKQALIDFALATKNELLFKRIMNGETEAVQQEEKSQEAMDQDEFIRQVNLKAWI